MTDNLGSRLDRLEQLTQKLPIPADDTPSMQAILLALYASERGAEFIDLARCAAIRGLTEEQSQRSVDLYRDAMLEAFGLEVWELMAKPA